MSAVAAAPVQPAPAARAGPASRAETQAATPFASLLDALPRAAEKDGRAANDAKKAEDEGQSKTRRGGAETRAALESALSLALPQAAVVAPATATAPTAVAKPAPEAQAAAANPPDRAGPAATAVAATSGRVAGAKLVAERAFHAVASPVGETVATNITAAEAGAGKAPESGATFREAAVARGGFAASPDDSSVATPVAGHAAARAAATPAVRPQSAGASGPAACAKPHRAEAPARATGMAKSVVAAKAAALPFAEAGSGASSDDGGAARPSRDPSKGKTDAAASSPASPGATSVAGSATAATGATLAAAGPAAAAAFALAQLASPEPGALSAVPPAASGARVPSAPAEISRPVREIDVDLSPGGVEGVSMTMRLSGDRLSVVVRAASRQTASAIETARDAIAERLAAIGQPIASFIVQETGPSAGEITHARDASSDSGPKQERSESQTEGSRSDRRGGSRGF